MRDPCPGFPEGFFSIPTDNPAKNKETARRLEENRNADGAGQVYVAGTGFQAEEGDEVSLLTPTNVTIRGQITGQVVAGYPFYSFQQTTSTAQTSTPGGLLEVTSGVEAQNPLGIQSVVGNQLAQERNGNVNVPTGTFVDLWLGDDGQTWYFLWQAIPSPGLPFESDTCGLTPDGCGNWSIGLTQTIGTQISTSLVQGGSLTTNVPVNSLVFFTGFNPPSPPSPPEPPSPGEQAEPGIGGVVFDTEIVLNAGWYWGSSSETYPGGGGQTWSAAGGIQEYFTTAGAATFTSASLPGNNTSLGSGTFGIGCNNQAGLSDIGVTPGALLGAGTDSSTANEWCYQPGSSSFGCITLTGSSTVGGGTFGPGLLVWTGDVTVNSYSGNSFTGFCIVAGNYVGPGAIIFNAASGAGATGAPNPTMYWGLGSASLGAATLGLGGLFVGGWTAGEFLGMGPPGQATHFAGTAEFQLPSSSSIGGVATGGGILKIASDAQVGPGGFTIQPGAILTPGTLLTQTPITASDVYQGINDGMSNAYFAGSVSVPVSPWRVVPGGVANFSQEEAGSPVYLLSDNVLVCFGDGTITTQSICAGSYITITPGTSPDNCPAAYINWAGLTVTVPGSSTTAGITNLYFAGPVTNIGGGGMSIGCCTTGNATGSLTVIGKPGGGTIGNVSNLTINYPAIGITGGGEVNQPFVTGDTIGNATATLLPPGITGSIISNQIGASSVGTAWHGDGSFTYLPSSLGGRGQVTLQGSSPVIIVETADTLGFSGANILLTSGSTVIPPGATGYPIALFRMSSPLIESGAGSYYQYATDVTGALYAAIGVGTSNAVAAIVMQGGGSMNLGFFCNIDTTRVSDHCVTQQGISGNNYGSPFLISLMSALGAPTPGVGYNLVSDGSSSLTPNVNDGFVWNGSDWANALIVNSIASAGGTIAVTPLGTGNVNLETNGASGTGAAGDTFVDGLFEAAGSLALALVGLDLVSSSPAKVIGWYGTGLDSATFNSPTNGYIPRVVSGVHKLVNPLTVGPVRVAGNDSTGLTGAATITTYTPGSLGSFRVSPYLNITARSLDVLNLVCTYTDENSNSATATFFPMGLTSASLATVGNFNFPPTVVRSGANAIKVIAVLTTGIGSVAYDAGVVIEQIA